MWNLDQFNYDVFLSYGWAGIQDPNVGDRAWIKEFKAALEADLSGNLGREARIFLDIEQPQNGELQANLLEAVASSATFLCTISPGSCRPDSWSRWEVDHFLKNAPTILAGSRQLFAALVRDVPRSEWNPALTGMVFRDFLNNGNPRLPLPHPSASDFSTGSGPILQLLSYDISKVLQEIRERVETTVFLGYSSAVPASRLDRLEVEIRRRKGTVIRGTYTEGEPQGDFEARLNRQLRSSGIAVCFDPDAIAEAPPSWQAAPQIIQQQAIARIFKKQPNRCLKWADSASGNANSAELPNAQDLVGIGFEYLESTLRDTFQQQAISSQREPAIRRKGENFRYLYLKCEKVDRDKLSALKRQLDPDRIEIIFDLLEGDPQELREANSTRVKWSSGVAVYYGTRPDLGTHKACTELEKILDGLGGDRPRAVLLDPDTDPVRNSFRYPGFEYYPSHNLEPSFIERLRSC